MFKFLSVILVFLFAFGCGSGTGTVEENKPPTTSAVTPEKQKQWDGGVSQVVGGSCAVSGCHAGGAITNLTSPAAVLANAKAKARVTAGTMPPPASPQATAFNADKKDLFLKFYQ